MVQLHELELHRPEQVLGLVQQPLVDVCVNGLLNTVDPEATAYKLDKMIWLLCTSDFYLEGGLKLFSTNALVESNLSAYSGDGI